MPALSGRYVPVLNVRDVAASAAWYERVLGLAEVGRYVGSDATLHQVVLVDPATGLTLCLTAARLDAPFNELSVGLDHLELLVDSRSELDRWVGHLDAHAVAHSGVKEPRYSESAIVTFRDPDNIQLELFCPKR